MKTRPDTSWVTSEVNGRVPKRDEEALMGVRYENTYENRMKTGMNTEHTFFVKRYACEYGTRKGYENRCEN